VPYFSGADGTHAEPSVRSLPATEPPPSAVRVTSDTFPPPGSFALISVLTGLFFVPSAGLSASGGPLGALGVDGAAEPGAALTSEDAPPTNSGFFSSPPHPVSASDAARVRAPTTAPARVNRAMPTSVLAYLADIVPHHRRKPRPDLDGGGRFEAFCRQSSTEGGTRVTELEPAREGC
jgi:hypothetical protein